MVYIIDIRSVFQNVRLSSVQTLLKTIFTDMNRKCWLRRLILSSHTVDSQTLVVQCVSFILLTDRCPQSEIRHLTRAVAL